jgi:hypothetical protein
LTYNGTYEFAIGETVVVSGVTPSGYNGSYVVTGSSPGSVSYASSTTGSLSASGIISNTATVPGFQTELGSNNVTVTLNDHGYQVGDTFPILIVVSIGGISLYGNFNCFNTCSGK